MGSISKPALFVVCASLFFGGCSTESVSTDTYPLSSSARSELRTFDRALDSSDVRSACSASELQAMRQNFLIFIGVYDQIYNPQSWSDADVAEFEKSMAAWEASGSNDVSRYSTSCIQAVHGDSGLSGAFGQ